MAGAGAGGRGAGNRAESGSQSRIGLSRERKFCRNKIVFGPEAPPPSWPTSIECDTPFPFSFRLAFWSWADQSRGPLDGEWLYIQLFPWKFSHKETLKQTQVAFYLKKTQKSLFEPPIGDVGVTYAHFIQSAAVAGVTDGRQIITRCDVVRAPTVRPIYHSKWHRSRVVARSPRTHPQPRSDNRLLTDVLLAPTCVWGTPLLAICYVAVQTASCSCKYVSQ